MTPQTEMKIDGRNTSQFPFLDLEAQFATLRQEIAEAVTQTLESQHFILGPEVEAFEKDVNSVTGSSHSISCASGSDALILALLALDIGPADEVITTPFTFIASAGSIARVGAKPVFVDIAWVCTCGARLVQNGTTSNCAACGKTYVVEDHRCRELDLQGVSMKQAAGAKQN